MAQDDRREALRKLFPRTEPAGGTFAWHFLPPAPTTPGWRMLKTLAPPPRGLRWERRHFLTVKPEEVVEVLSLECPSAADAREAALDYMRSCSSPTFQTGDKVGYDFGEASWSGPGGPGGLALFVRGNLAVAVRRATGSPAVEPVARWADGLLAVRPGAAEGYGRTAPSIARFEAGPVTGDKKRPLLLEVQDPLKRPVWCQFFVEGGRLERGESGLTLTVTAPEVVVEAFCFNENAHWTHGRLAAKA